MAVNRLTKSSGVVGVVLLGGASSRMGSEKSELSLNGVSLAQRATDTLNNAGFETVLISSGNKPQGIQDQITGKGPIGGMHAVMNQFTNSQVPGFVFLPVDMPLVTAEMVRLLAESGCTSGSACQYKGWPIPCYLPNILTVLEVLTRALSENKLAIKHLLDKLNAVEIPWQKLNQDAFTNINTPQQWSTYKQLVSN